MDNGQYRSFVGYAAFDAFGYEFVYVAFVVLEITVFRALRHRAEATHAAVFFVRAALEQHDFARSFFGTGEHGAEHDGVCARREGFGNVAGVADAAITDQGYTRAFQGFGHVGNRRNLRYADTRDDARGTDGARANADFHAVRAVFYQRQCGFGGSDIATDHVNVRVVFFDPFDAIENALRMTVCGVNDDDVHAGLSQQVYAFVVFRADANRCAYTQLAVCVFGGVRVGGGFLNVFDGDQTAQLVVVVNHHHAFQTVFVEQSFGHAQIIFFFDGDQALAWGHFVHDFGGHVFFKA